MLKEKRESTLLLIFWVPMLLRKTDFMHFRLVDEDVFRDVVSSMLKVSQLDVPSLVDYAATLSFDTTYFAMRFYLLPNVLLDCFSVTTPIGGSILGKNVYRICSVSLSLRVTLVYLIEFYMLTFDGIFVMDWFHLCCSFLIVELV